MTGTAAIDASNAKSVIWLVLEGTVRGRARVDDGRQRRGRQGWVLDRRNFLLREGHLPPLLVGISIQPPETRQKRKNNDTSVALAKRSRRLVVMVDN